MTPLEIIEIPKFSPEFCGALVSEIEKLESRRFVDRSKGTTLYRTIDQTEAKYRSVVNLDIPRPLREALIAAAPKVGSFLEEIIINWYEPGDFIPKHIDGHQYTSFCVVPLVENGDGFSAYFDGPSGEETFFEDIVGTGILVSGNKLLHEVKPVKHKRYIVLYLYL